MFMFENDVAEVGRAATLSFFCGEGAIVTALRCYSQPARRLNGLNFFSMAEFSSRFILILLKT
jgi:hypothetical protein